MVIAAVLGGWRSGAVAIAAGQLLTWYVVVEPRWTFGFLDQQRLGAFLVATATQMLVVLAIGLYQREIEQAAAEREQRMDLLTEALREIDHRTRNNYQTVLALIQLQAQRTSDPEVQKALKQVADRIEAISLTAKQLALRSGDIGTVRLHDHLHELCAHVERGLSSDKVQVEPDLGEGNVSASNATYISIIVNELITNALKHAFAEGAEGKIIVRTRHSDSALEVTVADNGAGIDLKAPRRGSGLGTRLVERFVRQLGASHEVQSSSSGTTHRLLVPARK